MKRKAFTLVELLIVVVVLGIVAAVVIPTLRGHAATAREQVAKDSLETLRIQIALYRVQHGGSPPGYANGIPVATFILQLQFIATTTITGEASPSAIPSAPFINGPYVRELPENPFNGLSNIAYVPVGTAFSEAVNGSTGWLYKKETTEFRLNWPGTDSKGVNFYDY